MRHRGEGNARAHAREGRGGKGQLREGSINGREGDCPREPPLIIGASVGDDNGAHARHGLQDFLQRRGGGGGAGSSSGTVSKSAFEQAFANGENTAKADKIFGKIDQNSDGTIDQSEAQNALKHLQQPWNAAGMQSPSGTQTGGQGNSSQGSWLSGSNLLLMAQQLGQAA